jgi:hypothetical protein
VHEIATDAAKRVSQIGDAWRYDRPAGQGFPQRRFEIGRQAWLDDVAQGTGCLSGTHVVAVVMHRQKHNLGMRAFRPQPTGRLDAIERGHPDIEHEQVRFETGRFLNDGLAIGDCLDDLKVRLEELRGRGEEIRMITRQDYASPPIVLPRLSPERGPAQSGGRRKSPWLIGTRLNRRRGRPVNDYGDAPLAEFCLRPRAADRFQVSLFVVFKGFEASASMQNESPIKPERHATDLSAAAERLPTSPANRAFLAGDFSRMQLVIAFAIAALSDAVSIFVTVAPPIAWGVDLVTAALLFIVLGWRWLLLPGLIMEAIPGFGVFPFWLVVVAAIVVWGTARPRVGGGSTAPLTAFLEKLKSQK